VFESTIPESGDAKSIAILEAAYAVGDASSETYLDRLATTIDTAFDPAGRSHVCVVWTFDASQPGAMNIETTRVVRGDPAVWEGMAKISASFDAETVKRTYLSSHGLQTALATLDATNPDAAKMCREIYPQFGFHDMAGLNVTDPSGRGAVVTWALPDEGRQIPRGAQIRWGRIAAHVAAGMRLRRHVEPEVEALVRPDGTVDHAEGAATSRSALESLREAVRIRERARTTSDDEGLIEAWRGLVAGRWSLVDRFDTNGRRVFLARRNDPREAKHVALTQLEVNVARLASVGHSNKLLAYELGVGESTISTALSRAMSKLGVATRSELVDLVWSFGGAHELA